MTGVPESSGLEAETSPARFLLPPLLLLLALLPPEARGESMVGCALLLALLVTVSWRAVEGSRRTDSLLVPILSALSLVAALASEAHSHAVGPVAMFTLAACAGLAAARCPRSAARAAAPSFVLAGCLVSAHALYQSLWGLADLAGKLRQLPSPVPDGAAVLARLEAGRAFANFATPAALGGFLVLCLPVTVAFAVPARGWRRFLLGGAAALQVAGLLASASVTAGLALFAALSAAALLWSRSRRRLAVGLVAICLLLAGVVSQRENLFDPARGNNPLKLRAGNFRAAIEMVREEPWLGVGPGGFADAYPQHRRPGDNETRHAHDLPLELAAELGIPAGAVLSGLFFWLFFRPLVRGAHDPPWQQGAAVGLAAFALHNLADFTAFLPSVLWSASLLLGLASRRDADPPTESAAAPRLRLAASAELSAVLLASIVVARGGLAWNARVTAREAAFAGEHAGALALAERATVLAPWDSDAALLLARLTLASGQNSAATTADRSGLALAERAVRLAPRRAAARAVRARARMQVSDPEGAYADLRVAARLYPMATEYSTPLEQLRESMVRGESVELGSRR